MPQVEATRAFLDERVAGDWEDLARLLVAPGTLPFPAPGDPARQRTGPTGTMALPVLDEPAPDEPDDPGEDVVGRAAGTTPVCLVKASAEQGRAVFLGDLLRRLAHDRARTLVLAPTPEAADLVLHDLGAAELRPVRAEPPDGSTDAVDEIRRLRRQLLWLEQWPRDQATLSDAQADGERRREALSAAEQQVAGAMEAMREQIEAAEQRAREARERHTGLGEEHRRTAEEAAKARAAWQELQAVADGAAQSAGEHTRTADAAHARHRDLSDQVTRCERQRQAARDREATLNQELTGARESLPEAIREAERLAAAAGDASAEGHASYYRLAAAESARAAHRRKLSWGQRLHVAPAPPETEDLRHQVKARIREADEAAQRAREAAEAAERAEAHRAGMQTFIADGERELAAVRTAQERLGEDLVRLSAERDTAYAEYQRQAAVAGEAVDRGTRAATAARNAREVSAAAEERGNAAQRAQGEAATAARVADEEREAATRRLAGLEADLAQRRADSVAKLAELDTELGAVAEAEAGSRGHVREICGAEPTAELIAGHRSAAMTRIDGLTAELESATPVCGTPAELAAGPYARTAFDVLIVTDADRLGDGDLLVGAVRARRWILIADGQGVPPPLSEDGQALSALDESLQRSVFERTAVTAPALCLTLG